MKSHILRIKGLLILSFLLTGSLLSGQIRKDLIVTIQPVHGMKDVFQLQCSSEEHAAARNASSVFTTRLPTLPLKLNKWEESIYVLSNRKVPMQKVRLIDDVTFRYPLAGICRKAMLAPDPEEPGAYLLKLFWYEGKLNRFMEISYFRIWSIVSLQPGVPTRIGFVELEK